MKQGMTLQQLATEAARIKSQKVDYLASTRQLYPRVNGDACEIEFDDNTGDVGNVVYGIRSHAHSQIADRLKIPAAYYRRMINDAPHLWAENVSHWFNREPRLQMVRTLDDEVRAFLSNRYRRMDNADLIESVLPIFTEGISTGAFEVVSQNLSESYMHLKIMMPKVTAEVEPGDVVQAGISIRNSEIGLSRLTIAPMVMRLVCKNGMIADEFAESRTHLGAAMEADNDIATILSNETLKAEDQALWMKVRDIATACTNRRLFEKIVHRLRAARTLPIYNEFTAVERLRDTHGLTQAENESVLDHLIDGGDLSQYGLIQAVSRMSQDVGDYDKADTYERLAGHFLTLTPAEWKPYAGEPTPRINTRPY